MTRDKDFTASLLHYNCHKRRNDCKAFTSQWHRFQDEMAVECHHPELSRLKADELLKSSGLDGSYLIRNSESLSGVYILCMLCGGRVHQYRILKNEDTGLIYIPAENARSQREYSDLRQMIQEISQLGEKNGLRCALLHPINRQDNDDDSEEEDIGGVVPATSCQTLTSSTSAPPRSPLATSPAGQALQDSNRLQVVKRSSDSNKTSETGNTSPKPVSLGITPAQGADVSKYLMKRFTSLDLSCQDGQFVNDVRDYLDSGIERDRTSQDASGLKQLLVSNSAALQKSVQDFLSKVNLLNTAFGLPGPQVSSPASHHKDVRCFEVSQLAQDLEKCSLALTSFHKQATAYLRELERPITREPDLIATISKKECFSSHDNIPQKTFTVVIPKLGKFTDKIVLTVNIMAGNLKIGKIEKDKMETYNHVQVEQVVRWPDNNRRLDIKLEGRNKTNTYEFTDVWQRETFCQYMGRMKKQHMADQDLDQISLFVGTWNMGSDSPPAEQLSTWFRSQGTGKTRDSNLSVIAHDLYVIGTQESSLSDKDWINKVKESIRNSTDTDDLHVVACSNLWSIRLLVLIQSKYKNKISRVTTDSVKTGIANTLGNKGAVGVSFSIDGTSFCFITCHLTSGHERNARRNQNSHDIIKGLSGLKPKGALGSCDVISLFHHVFFLGDLNYRLEDDDPANIVRTIQNEKKAKCSNYSVLLKLDQLKKTQERHEAFCGFNEEEITFPPTYRIAKGSRDTYEYQKFKTTGVRINAPSWCDRILWQSYPDTYNKCTSYGCVEEICTSDHKPVFASFDVGITRQPLTGSKNNPVHHNAQIVFQEIRAELKSSCKFTSQIDFYSPCLPSQTSSKSNMEFTISTPSEDLCCPKWPAARLPPPLLPLFNDRDYLEDQHLLMCVKNVESQESYGECVISLKSMISDKPEAFDCSLTHNGEETGRIRGFMHVEIREPPTPANKRRRRSYEYVVTNTLKQDMRVLKQLGAIQDIQEAAVEALHKSSSFDLGVTDDSHRNIRRRSMPVSDGTNNNLTSGRSRPRMGQSSLSQPPVFPAATSRYDENCNSRNSRDFMSKRLASAQDSARPMAFYNSSNPPQLAPPPVPIKSSHTYEPSYDSLKCPLTINEWLLDLGLPEYIQVFFSHGWDNMTFIQDMTPADLKNMNIHNAEHVNRIMDSIKDMKS